MRQILVITIIALCTQPSLAQIFELEGKVENIPVFDNNRQFLLIINKEYEKIITQNADTILLYYPIEYKENYAVLFWKKNKDVHSMAVYQNHPFIDTISKEMLHNEILDKIDIKSMHDILQDDRMRYLDTNVLISHGNDPVYCLFYFDNIKKLTAGYRLIFKSRLPLEFTNALADEEYRIHTGKPQKRSKTN